MIVHPHTSILHISRPHLQSPIPNKKPSPHFFLQLLFLTNQIPVKLIVIDYDFDSPEHFLRYI
jgi:hypothetical protein